MLKTTLELTCICGVIYPLDRVELLPNTERDRELVLLNFKLLFL